MSYILEDDQLEEIWNKADCSRGDQAYLRDEIFDLVNTVNHYKQLAEERGKALEWYADEANHATSDVLYRRYSESKVIVLEIEEENMKVRQEMTVQEAEDLAVELLEWVNQFKEEAAANA